MLKSMTGYGKGECTLYNRKFTVEIKSVNHRYGEISIKLPRALNALEDRIKLAVGAGAARGKIDVYVGFETYSREDAAVKLNKPLCDNYVEVLRSIKTGYDLSDDVTLAIISRFPDVISFDRNAADEKAVFEMREALDAALAGAMDKFISMREKEGEAIRADLEKKTAALAALVESVRLRAPLVAAEYEARLKAKVSEALGDIQYDEARLIQEVTIFADKACVDEELTRLKSHLAQFGGILETGGQSGKKLDFLIQEINREVNTIGSKSNDLEITKTVVEMKSELEKIREQVQNIE